MQTSTLEPDLDEPEILEAELVEPEFIVAELVDDSALRAAASANLVVAWWGLIPAIVFVVLQMVLRWPEAVSQTSVTEAITFVIGGTALVVLVVVGITCIVYRVAGRRQLPATLTLFSLMSLLCLSTVATWALDASGVARPSDRLKAKLLGSKSSANAPEPSSPEMASFGAFEFEIPKGWTLAKPDRSKTVAMILPRNEVWGRANALVKVDVCKPTKATARQMAQSFAGRDGRVLHEPVMLDGVEAIRVHTAGKDLSRPRYVVVAYRDHKAYLIMAGAKGSGISEPFEHVLETWRWAKTPDAQ